jgi:hypothetical protein
MVMHFLLRDNQGGPAPAHCAAVDPQQAVQGIILISKLKRPAF